MRTLLELNYTAIEVTDICGCCVKTVNKWAHRFAANVGIEEFQDRRCTLPGGPYKITEFQLQQVIVALHNNPFQPVNRLPDILGIDCCAKTLRKALKTRANLFYHKAAIKTAMTQNHKLRRLDYAIQHQNRSTEDWEYTVVMDGKVFSSSKDGRSNLIIYI